MNIAYSFRHTEATGPLKAYIERKFEKIAALAERFGRNPRCAVAVQRITHHREGMVFEVTVTLHAGSAHISNTEHAADLYAAIDKMELEIARQLQKCKEKPLTLRRNAGKAFKNGIRDKQNDSEE